MFIPASQGTAIVELGSQGRIRTHGCFRIGGFHRRNRPLCHPSRLLLLRLTSLTGLFRAFRAASCSAHRIATAFMPPKPASFSRGILATFRLVCRACSPSPFVVRTVCDTSNSMSRKSFYTSNDKIKKNPYSVE